MPRKHMKHVATRRGHINHYAVHMRPMHRMAATRSGASRNDNVANQLNRQEAQRLSGSSTRPMMAPTPTPQPMYQGQ
jgi:hypothetical protein